jgi:hypothetical protein
VLCWGWADPVRFAALAPMGPAEDIQKFFDGGIQGFAASVFDVIKGAFSSTDMNSNWWVSVIGGTVNTHVGGQVTTVVYPGMLTLLVQVMAPVMVILVAAQVVVSLFRSSTVGLIRAGATAVFAIPATYILAGIMFTLIQVMDNISVYILAAGNNDGEDAVTTTVLALFGLTWDPATKSVVLDENYQQWALAKDQNNPGAILVPVILIFVIWIIALLLAAFMVFRMLGLIVLASLLPIAAMSQPLEAAKGIFKGFGTTALALLIAKPLSALVLKLGFVISATSNTTFQFLAGILCLLMAAVMPVLTMKFMAFLTGGAGDGIIGGGSGIGSAAGRRFERHGGSALRSTRQMSSRIARMPARIGRGR